jgi:hypothetical protein
LITVEDAYLYTIVNPHRLNPQLKKKLQKGVSDAMNEKLEAKRKRKMLLEQQRNASGIFEEALAQQGQEEEEESEEESEEEESELEGDFGDFGDFGEFEEEESEEEESEEEESEEEESEEEKEPEKEQDKIIQKLVK